jgi:uncharacterized protein (DUF1778 family)
MAGKDYTLQVRLNKAEKETLEIAAKTSGVSTSSWVRDRLRRAARQELQASGIKVPFLEEMNER